MIDHPFQEQGSVHGTVSIAAASLLLLLHHFIVSSEWFGSHIGRESGPDALSIRKVMYRRFLGFFLFGLIPLLLVLLVFRESPVGYGLSVKHLQISFLLWIAVAAGIVAISYYVARGPKNLAVYPQIRIREWSGKLLALSALGWTVYLSGYEFLLRGFLLFSSLKSFGPWTALAINLCIYSLAHVPKGPRETLGSLLFGFLLCYPTLRLGSIWFALLTHITLALSNEWFSLRFQPDMKFIKKRKGL